MSNTKIFIVQQEVGNKETRNYFFFLQKYTLFQGCWECSKKKDVNMKKCLLRAVQEGANYWNCDHCGTGGGGTLVK